MTLINYDDDDDDDSVGIDSLGFVVSHESSHIRVTGRSQVTDAGKAFAL